MPDAHDAALGKVLLGRGLITGEQAAKLPEIQGLLAGHAIRKTFAAVVVESGWVPKERIQLAMQSVPGHPPLEVTFSSLQIEAAAQRAIDTGEIDSPRRAQLQALAAILHGHGYTRSLAELAFDCGLVKGRPASDDDRPSPPGSSTKTPSRVGAGTTSTRKTDPPESRGTSSRVKPPETAPERQTGLRARASDASTASPAARGTSVRTKAPEPSAPSRGTSVRTKAPEPAAGSKGTSVRTKAPEPGRATSVRPRPSGGAKIAILAGGGTAAILLVGLLAFLATRPGPTPPKPPDPGPGPIAQKPPDPSKDPPQVPAVDPPKPDPDEEFKRQLEEQQRRNAEEQCSKLWELVKELRKDGRAKEALARLGEMATSFSKTRFYEDNRAPIEDAITAVRREVETDAVAVDPPVKPRPIPDLERPKDLKPDYEKRKASRLAEAAKRIAEAKRAIDAERATERDRLAEQIKRVAGKKLTLALKSGLRLANAGIVAMTRDGVRLSCEYEGSPVEMDFAWEAIDDRSYIALMRAIHAADGAKGLYEVGRQCITRKLWKEAKAAFDECVAADGAFADRVPDLGPILNNQGAFQGMSKRVGRDTLVLTYDFAEADQAKDWKGQSGQKELPIASNAAALSARGLTVWSLKDVDFEGEVSVDAAAAIEDKASFVVGFHYTWERKGYFLHLGPSGAQLYRWDGAPANAPLSKKDARIAGEVALRISVRGGAIKVTSNGAEVFSASDGTHKKGWLLIGAQGGSVTLRKLGVTGKVDPVELDKRFAETEVLARRALEGDLGKKKERDARDVTLSADDEYFTQGIPDSARNECEGCKDTILTAIRRGSFTYAEIGVFKKLDKILADHPGYQSARYWRGVGYLMTNRAEQARKDFEEAAAANPDFHEARAALGETWLNELKFEKARRCAEDALKIAPDSASALGLRAFLKFVDGDAKGSVAEFEVAVKLDPDDPDVKERFRNISNVVKGPVHLGCKHVKEFPHYIVMTDISMEKTKLYGERLEAAYKHYAETFKEFYREDPKRPKPRVAIFNTREAYLTYGELTLSRRQELTLGYFHPMYKELLLFEDADMEDTLQTLYHEAFHQFMSCMVPRAPYWYNEGIAEYMGSITVEKGKIVAKGKVLEGRLKNLKMQLQFAIKFERIMTMTNGEFYSGNISFNYAQAWSMIHFFYEHEGGKHRALLDGYFKALLDGKERVEAFQAAFGKTDLNALMKEWRDYAGKLK